MKSTLRANGRSGRLSERARAFTHTRYFYVFLIINSTAHVTASSQCCCCCFFFFHCILPTFNIIVQLNNTRIVLCKNAKSEEWRAKSFKCPIVECKHKVPQHDSNTVAISNSATWRIYRRSRTHSVLNSTTSKAAGAFFNQLIHSLLVCVCATVDINTDSIRFGSNWMTFFMWYSFHRINWINNTWTVSPTYTFTWIFGEVLPYVLCICTIYYGLRARIDKSNRPRMCGK